MSLTTEHISWEIAPEAIENALEKVLLSPSTASAEIAQLYKAMQYATLGGGKRLRAMLVIEAAAAVCRRNKSTFVAEKYFFAACAVELIHAYSLVHDDLPAMDDADLRRGRPSCHKKFGEAQAILSGDGLLNLAHEVLLQHADSPATLHAAKVLSRAAGTLGMVGGQYEDISWSNAEGLQITADQLLAMQSRKTGALIRAAVESGAILAQADEQQSRQLRQYGAALGRAFQLQDDLLDVEGDPELMGKTSSDDDNDKLTAPSVLGMEQTKVLAQQSCDEALAVLADWGDAAKTLRQLARFAITRKK